MLGLLSIKLLFFIKKIMCKGCDFGCIFYVFCLLYMKKIIVKLEERSYPIIIGNGLFNDPLFFIPLEKGDRVLCVTDDYVASHYLDVLFSVLNRLGVVVDQLVLSNDGEKNKSLIGLDLIFTKLLTKNYDRNTVLIAFGGGVIGDLTGFAASIYQRGIRFIQIPTTLLAQVDASIGGKTGINHILGKNMIGSFYQPISVIINLDFLSTLSSKELSCGLSEVIKYAVAFDVIFFNWLENNLDNLLGLDVQFLMYCICRCCEIKASVVSMDEYERNIRSLLNFGHTYGHAIESYFGYVKKWSHGEAIAAGIMIAANTAICLGEFDRVQANRIKLLLIRAGLPVCGPEEMVPTDYLQYMNRDKKSTSGEINLILPVSTIGNVKKFLNVQRDVVLSSIKESYN